MKTFYITTPIYYANSMPHLGHLYTTMVADCVTRYRRQRGYETFFLTGTDEHGINVQRAAARNGRTPKEHVDYIVGELKQSFAAFKLDGAHGGYDIFMRTTEPFHYEAVAEFWRRVAAATTPKGREAIYKGHYEGWFCAPCATFKTEDEYARPEREGDPPLCLVHEAPLDRVAEESYFFRLSDYAEALLALYESRPDFIRPDVRRNEVISFVKGGLQDLSVSRLKSSVSWAIPVPGDPEHTIYIWLDALSNYITALGWGSAEGERERGFDKFWPGTHLIGKDILRQHAIYWPAFLLAAGIEQPAAVIAHGTWLDHVGRKMSKTLGNSIELPKLERHFSPDIVRYFCLREMVFGQDSKFGYESLIERTNSDLASGLGNLSSRTLTMIGRYCDGRTPAPDIEEDRRLQAKRAGVDADGQELATTLEHARDSFVQLFEDFAFSRALEIAWTIIARADKMISDAKPWELAKDESQRQTLNAVLYRAAETLRWLAVLLHPVMPDATRAIWTQLGQTDDIAKSDPAKLLWGGIQAGTRIGEVAPVFPRIDKAKIMAEIEKENPTQEAAKPETSASQTGTHATEADAVPGSTNAAETKPEPPQRGATEADAVPQAQSGTPEGVATFIGIEDFVKVEMRVGEILTAERIPKSDKLLRFTIDLGEAAPRQILAGIAEYYEPETLVGRKVAVVSNLKPRKLRGFESQGMVLAASVGDEGRPVLATFTEDVPNGARLK
ncbi:MAG TPA: methionine--tRNA ligase [Pyrinomonadaceae bacterium]|jgi:methionyl-tRNA synthetase|nr:methionine--tRNA ligase [Pyrinomonadaceae bacterium]